jgi:DNA-binding NtrC family response regulator
LIDLGKIIMPSPKLFMHIQDPLLASNLLSLKSLCQYELNISQQTENWLEQLIQTQCDIALIEVDSLHDSALKELIDSPVLCQTEFLFFSKGNPDPILDHLMKKGAGFHYRAPYHFQLIDSSLEEIFRELNLTKESINIETSYLDQFGLLVGSSPAMHSLYRTIRKVAVTKANVFIIGESGTGKELVANTLHVFSPRAEAPFVAINCGALSPELIDSELFGHVKGAFTGAHKDHQGVFEQAEGGTLFLDEVTEMPYEHQVKLLRVLESGEYKPVGAQQVKIANVRIVAATNRIPSDAIQSEIFREDLYFRLAQFPIFVPKLKDREGDACGLAQHFLAYRNAQDGQQKQLSSSSLDKISHYHWPGNVRELKHAIERAYILADKVIHPEHLITNDANRHTEEDQTAGIPIGMRLEEIEKIAILKTLKNNEGNRSDTAHQLGISIKTLYNKLDKYENHLSPLETVL